MTLPPRVPRAARPTPTSRLRLENLEGREVPAVVGALDPTFDTDGKLTTDLGFTPSDVAVDSIGRVVVVGTTTGADATLDFIVARFGRDGMLDTSFGSGGKRTINFTVAGTSQTDT